MTINQQIGAGIDLGSNTFRLLVADCSTKNPVVLAKELATVRLGRGLRESGRLQDEAVKKGLAVLQGFRDILVRFQPCSIRICGTEALRLARNSRFFLDQAATVLGHPVDIINGEEEARLSLAGLFFTREDMFATPLLLADVGGGSTELVLAESPAEYLTVTSIPVGVVWLTEKFFTDEPQSLKKLDRLLTDSFTEALEKLKIMTAARQASLVGSGGSATSMAALYQGLTVYDPSRVHGYIMRHGAIEELWSKLSTMTADELNRLPGLEENRGEILPAGIRIFHILIEILHQDKIHISDTGLLEGILLSGLNCGHCCS